MNNPWHLYVMSALYIFAGTMHFIKPKAFMRIMPKYIPNHKALVLWSGGFEIILGISLFAEELKDLALTSIIIMLTLFLIVHFHMLSGKKAAAGFPRWLLILRIPLQFGLMYWAYYYL